jgi:hypothetical protein
MGADLCRNLPAWSPWGPDLLVAPDGFRLAAYPDTDPTLRKRAAGRACPLGPGRQAPAIVAPSEP